MHEKFYELTNPQKSIWFTEEIYKGTPIENIEGAVIIKDKVNFTLLKQAINIFVEKSDSFRLKFIIKDNKVQQFIDKYHKFPIEIVNVNSDEDLKKVEKDTVLTPFNIIDSFLYVFKLVKFPDNHGGFIINMHHLISDAWSGGLGATEIIKIYSLLLHKEDTSNIEYPSYTEYINSELEYMKSDKYNKDKVFWEKSFEIVPEIASIPYSKSTAKNKLDCSSNRKQFTIEKNTINIINEFCKTNKVSAFNFFMSVFSIYIGKISGLDTFVIGSPILNRCNLREKHTSGMFINTIPLKINLNDNDKFIDLASKISSDLFSIFKHQKYPYLSLLETLRHVDNTIPNLYSILISYQNIRSSARTSSVPYNVDWIPSFSTADDMNIHIYDMNDTGNINIAYDYQTSKYTEQDINNIHERILAIINQVLKNQSIKINRIEIITPEEKKKLLNDFNNSDVDYDKTQTISMLFEKQASLTPDRVALVFENKKMTYKELDEKSNSLANYLRSKGVKNNIIVGIMVNRSLEMLISILAVLKSGGTYIPIDPEYPQNRIDYMLQNSNAMYLLTCEALQDKINYDHKILVDLKNSNIYTTSSAPLTHINKPTDSSYIIYTSGSTGFPKGVVLTHQALTNLTNYSNNYISYLKDNVYRTIASVTTVCFDIFIFETLISLQRGLKVVIANDDEKTVPNLLNNLIEKHGITIIQTTPSRMQFFVNNYKDIPALKNLDFITLAGEQLPLSLAKQLKEISGATIYNGYGPSETTVFSTLTDVTNHKEITIGKPLDNTKIYILDKKLNLRPIGTTGELYIAGDGLGKGYLNNKELTDKSFIPNPFVPNTLMYKTGDLGCFKDNGEILCFGRCDTQVKIRGLRIELGEIEACIESYPNIDKAVVIVDEHQKIIAYYTADTTITSSDLKAFLQRQLPSYFIPNIFAQVKKFKLTPNGKIDKKALDKINISTTSEYEAPTTEYQKKLAKLFEKVLGISKVSISDNFFEIGGDSLSAIKLQIEAFDAGLSLSYKDIFKYPTIKLLSENITKTDKNTQFVEQEDYDYSNINALIAKNTNLNKVKLKRDKITNIFLTGCTGFLGSHILDYLLKHTRSNIYCLIRAKNNTDPQTRLLEILKFYFGHKYDKLIFKRIFAVEGNITNKKLGLNALYYDELGSSIDCVINCAAIVKHYGDSSIFKDTNIVGTQNIIDFCKKFNCKLIHISTLSVSGNIFNDNFDNSKNEITFSEKDLYINQDLSNIYIRTKFLAERLILENIINENLNAKIIRLGNITNRYSDGAFQINVSENAFMNRIHSFIQIGSIPISLKNIPIEFTPVDICANAIVNIAKHKDPFTIFHVYNNKFIVFEKLVKILNSLDIKLDFIEDDLFNKKVHALSRDEDTKHIISGIINDFSKSEKIKFVDNIKIENNFTNKYLRKTLFQWPKINEKYIKKYVAYLKSIGYI